MPGCFLCENNCCYVLFYAQPKTKKFWVELLSGDTIFHIWTSLHRLGLDVITTTPCGPLTVQIYRKSEKIICAFVRVVCSARRKQKVMLNLIQHFYRF